MDNLDRTVARLAVLFADIAGSTRLYERFGDELARGDVAACMKILNRVTIHFEGQTVKTIGDEAMCVFANPANAAMAAKEMHEALHDASEDGLFRTGELRIKVGWHYGPGSRVDNDVIGEASSTAQQVIKLAKAGQILLSAQALAALPSAYRYVARHVDRVPAESWRGELEVFELPWEPEDEITHVGEMSKAASGGGASMRQCALEYQGRQLQVNNTRPLVSLGRGDDNDLVVRGRFTSRHHASIEFRRGRFHLRDNSTNGTTLTLSDGSVTRLHREETTLSDDGTISLGSALQDDHQAHVQFRCL